MTKQMTKAAPTLDRLYFASAGAQRNPNLSPMAAKEILSDQEFFDAYCAEHEDRFGEKFEPVKRNPQLKTLMLWRAEPRQRLNA